MRTLFLLASASALAVAAPALAQDAGTTAPADTTAPAPAPMSDGTMAPADPMATPAPAPAGDYGSPAPAMDEDQFSGLYIGGAGGYDIQGNDMNSSLLFDRDLDGRFGDAVLTSAGANAFIASCPGQARNAVAGLGCNSDKDGWAYYGRVGVDKQMGWLVVGLVGEFGKSEIRDYVSSYSSTPAAYVMQRKINWEGGARLRAGFARNTTLFYGTGGGGYAQIGRSFATTNGLNDFDGRGKREKWGLQAGGGIEQKLGRNFSIGMEYMYHSYVDNDFRVRATAGTAPATNPFILPPNTGGTDFRRSDEVFRWHSIRGTAAFRF